MASKFVYYCKKCVGVINALGDSYLKCKICAAFVHIRCIPSRLFESGITGDVFFVYTCSECSAINEEIIIRDKISWFIAIVLALHDMSCKSSGISNQGYFHWKTHIINFIDRNWQNLFPHNLRRRKNWIGTIAGILSHNSPSFFLSGATDLNDNGWWKLSHDLCPGVTIMLYTDVISVKHKARNKKEYKQKESLMVQDEVIVLQLLKDYGLIVQQQVFEKNLKIIRKFINEFDKSNEDDSFTDDEVDIKAVHLDNEKEDNIADDISSQEDYNSDDVFDVDLDESHVNSILESDDLFNWKSISNNFMEDININDESILSNKSQVPNLDNKTDCVDSIYINSLFNINNEPRIIPWRNPVPEIKLKNIQPLSEYQEYEYYKKIRQYLEVISNDPLLLKHIDKTKLCEIRRLYCKLNVRKHLRKKRIEFNLDRFVSGRFRENMMKTPCNVNILDKFQVASTPDSENVFITNRLTGISIWNCFVSPYTNKTLKPIVRRDYETVSPWIKLMNEIKLKVCNESGKRAPIDYCYVRPHHIAVLNSLCEQFYWPGIDVSDVLQYPDYTIVALYKKLVVGFALLVPDANHNEAYITFFWTRPNWRKCGIGTFMLYHLIQTCIGKDITLHVSATNTALILYQKFGFKVEEFVQDFYDKYLQVSTKECKHALYLRLSR